MDSRRDCGRASVVSSRRLGLHRIYLFLLVDLFPDVVTRSGDGVVRLLSDLGVRRICWCCCSVLAVEYGVSPQYHGASGVLYMTPSELLRYSLPQRWDVSWFSHEVMVLQLFPWLMKEGGQLE